METVKLPDFGKMDYALQCPKCLETLNIQIEKIANQETVQCELCQLPIHLIDEAGKTREGLQKINALLNSIERQLDLWLDQELIKV